MVLASEPCWEEMGKSSPADPELRPVVQPNKSLGLMPAAQQSLRSQASPQCLFSEAGPSHLSLGLMLGKWSLRTGHSKSVNYSGSGHLISSQVSQGVFCFVFASRKIRALLSWAFPRSSFLFHAEKIALGSSHGGGQSTG